MWNLCKSVLDLRPRVVYWSQKIGFKIIFLSGSCQRQRDFKGVGRNKESIDLPTFQNIVTKFSPNSIQTIDETKWSEKNFENHSSPRRFATQSMMGWWDAWVMKIYEDSLGVLFAFLQPQGTTILTIFFFFSPHPPISVPTLVFSYVF